VASVQNPVEQGGFTRAKESGQDGDRDGIVLEVRYFHNYVFQ